MLTDEIANYMTSYLILNEVNVMQFCHQTSVLNESELIKTIINTIDRRLWDGMDGRSVSQTSVGSSYTPLWGDWRVKKVDVHVWSSESNPGTPTLSTYSAMLSITCQCIPGQIHECIIWDPYRIIMCCR